MTPNAKKLAEGLAGLTFGFVGPWLILFTLAYVISRSQSAMSIELKYNLVNLELGFAALVPFTLGYIMKKKGFTIIFWTTIVGILAAGFILWAAGAAFNQIQ